MTEYHPRFVVIGMSLYHFNHIRQIHLIPPVNIDGLVKSHKTPSPLMGEGRGEGEMFILLISYIPLPFIPSRKGRGNSTFYEFININ